MALPAYYSKSDCKKVKGVRASVINNRYNIYLNNNKILSRINENEKKHLSILDVLFIKKLINKELVKTKILKESQKNFLKNVMETWDFLKIEKLELIYKHFSDFKDESEPKTKNFTLKFKEKLNKL
jgi:hypothetical protein